MMKKLDVLSCTDNMVLLGRDSEGISVRSEECLVDNSGSVHDDRLSHIDRGVYAAMVWQVYRNGSHLFGPFVSCDEALNSLEDLGYEFDRSKIVGSHE